MSRMPESTSKTGTVIHLLPIARSEIGLEVIAARQSTCVAQAPGVTIDQGSIAGVRAI